MKKGMIFFAVALILALWITAGGRQESQQLNSMTALSQDTTDQIYQNSGFDINFGRMPVYFTANEGQMDERVAFHITGKDKEIYFTQEGVTFALIPNDNAGDENSRRWVVKLDFVGFNQGVRLRGEDATGAVISYFKGNPEEWQTGISTYSKLVYENLWPGIDLVYRGAENHLKYEFVVHPGADPGKIRMRYRGASGVNVNEEGELEIETPLGDFADGRPVAYQEKEGKRVGVETAYDLFEGDKGLYIYGFHIVEYDRSQTLIIDPAVLIYCGYIGGFDYDAHTKITVDSSGCAYIAGQTYSKAATFPDIVGPDIWHNGNADAFVAKIKSDGTGLVYCGYIGGSESDYGYDIAVDSSGCAYITGATESTEGSFPEIVGPDLSHNGSQDVFVAKVNTAGTGLSYCGYIGGSDHDYGYGIAVDSAGSAYVTGGAQSTQASFPVTVGPDLMHMGGYDDVFVAKVKSDGTGLVYCGYIGGSASDLGYDIAVDNMGYAYVTGRTKSTEVSFPTIMGPDLTFNGGSYYDYEDVFVAKVKSDGTGLVYCGYIGGYSADFGYGIAVDGSGSAYVAGVTSSSETTFPVSVGPDMTSNGSSDVFVAKVYASGTGLSYCGYIGGSDYDYCDDIAVDSSGCVYVTGTTYSTETTFPVTIGPDLTHNGDTDVFVAKVKNNGAGLVYCGYIGGALNENGTGVAVDGLGNAYVSGYTRSTEASFPVTKGPDLTQNGYWDVFVTKIDYYPVKNDFNSDRCGDIVWRNYGTGGNVLWYLSSTIATPGLSQGNLQNMTMEPGPEPVQTFQDVWEAGEILYMDEKVYHDVLEVDVPQERIEVKVYKDALAAGPVFFRPGAKGIAGDIQELMKSEAHQAGVQAIVILGTAYLNTITNTNWRIEATGDLNGDGNVDILWRHYVSGQNAVWYMSGRIIIGTAYLTTITDTLWRIEGTGDFNGDGNTDILWRHYGNGKNALWYMSGSVVIGTTYLGAITDVNWRIEATGDFDRDGNTDFVWRHYVSGQNALWYMSGSTHMGTVSLTAVTDVYWAIAGAGDFNGDGNTDLLWRHYVSGSNSVWYMSGPAIIGTEALSSVGDLNWKIENH